MTRHAGERPAEGIPANDGKGSFGRIIITLALVAFSGVFLLFGCFLLFLFFLSIVLGLPNDPNCCASFMSCKPCKDASTAYYPYPLLGLASLFVSFGPWAARGGSTAAPRRRRVNKAAAGRPPGEKYEGFR